jgi:hypothetical protein
METDSGYYPNEQQYGLFLCAFRELGLDKRVNMPVASRI